MKVIGEHKRPYELPQRLYGLWFEVGERGGWYAQSGLEQALCSPLMSGHLRFPTGQPMDESTIDLIERIAERRGVSMKSQGEGIWTFS